MVKAVIFDIDGTLVDTVDMHAETWQRAFREFGKEIDFQTVRDQVGKGGDQLIPVFLTKEEFDKFGEQISKRRNEIYQSDYMPKAKPFPKVRELFERIRSDGKRIALASSAPEKELKFYKKLLNISDLLEEETSADGAENSKPEPDIFQSAVHKLKGIEAGDCIVVGDTPYDAEAAGKAGIPTIGVLCGGFPEKWLRDSGCIEIYRDPADLLANYERSALAVGDYSKERAV
jgi:HAD superfamily hydrolase (TIGR01509 family)